MKTYTVLLTGLGHVGLNFLRILRQKEPVLTRQYGLALKIIGVADSSGILTDPDGLDLDRVIDHKEQKQGVGTLGQTGISALQLVNDTAADFLLDATPSDLRTGQPGLDLARLALSQGKHVVLASKSPLVHAYGELAALSRPAAQLRFSGAVCGAMPTVNVGRRDLPAAAITRIEAILNSTTQVILTLMAQGSSYESALVEAQRLGVAEPDPSLDVDGWDTANKLVIVANAVLNIPARLDDVVVRGIRSVEPHGEQWALLGLIERVGEGYRLSVEPVRLPSDHPLARLGKDEMGIVYTTDIYGQIAVTSAKQGPAGASAGMLRDVIDIHHTSQSS
ncbi:MAG: homoserine dehydrogenase [Chloroflexi bacterium]|nr:homoserine dehydrogenase [Chloroflexota bacterium]